ncbi:MAG: hypothetical protein H6737_21620 [Alphaproteobacteria bacterium]|nr:hypothetical protein [Alphaproteobacteria bacterium]
MAVCPSCGAPLPPEAFDGALGLAQCPACGEVVEAGPEPEPEPEALGGDWFDQEPAYAEPPPAMDLEPPPAALDRPLSRRGGEHGWLDQSGSNMVLVKPWMSEISWGIVLFAVIWNSFIVMGLTSGQPGILCTPHAWIGLVLAYWSAAMFIDETTITWEGRTLKVEHGPIPWWGGVELDGSDIDQLCVKVSSVKINKQPRWNVVAIARDGKERTVVRLVSTEDEARWLERRIEEQLDIVDRRVPGEA